jgi:betaine-aldehyde dehydrogenase
VTTRNLTAAVTHGHVVTYGHVIDGQDRPAGTDLIDRYSPATGDLVSRYSAATDADVDDAVRAARAAFDHGTWRDLDGMTRMRLMLRLATLMRDAHQELARLDAAEVGKPLRVARADIDGAIGQVEFAASLAAAVHGDIYTNLGADFTGLLIREPVGVVGVIVPWNFPALILCQKAAYALAAGCTVVIKPSEYTSASAVRIGQLALQAGIPPGVVNVITGTGAAGEHLSRHPDVDMITFTGSTATGRRVLEAAKTNLKKTSLELGGKAAQIVFADADIDDAVEGVLFGATHNQGECCVAGARLLVHDSIADAFCAALVERASHLVVGAGDTDTDFGALIHPAHLESVLAAVSLAQSEGSTLLAGGQRLQGKGFDSGCFLAPTILGDVAPESAAFQQEIFGPVLTVTRFSSIGEAIDLANAVSYGLGNTVWSKNIDTVLTVTRHLKSGTVWVNTSIDGSPQLSFGGVKASGYGREMGRAGLEEFTELKTVQIRTGTRRGTFGLTTGSR